MTSRTLPTRNITQNQLFERNFQNYIKKLHSNYKMLLVKHAELLQQSSLIGKHEELQIEAATDSIIVHSELLLEQIQDMKMHLILLYQNFPASTPLSDLKIEGELDQK